MYKTDLHQLKDSYNRVAYSLGHAKALKQAFALALTFRIWFNIDVDRNRKPAG